MLINLLFDVGYIERNENVCVARFAVGTSSQCSKCTSTLRAATAVVKEETLKEDAAVDSVVVMATALPGFAVGDTAATSSSEPHLKEHK